MLKVANSFRGILLLAGCLLLAHTLVPHQHGNPGSANEVTGQSPVGTPSTNWLDFLSRLVDTDMGHEHLEHFSPEKTGEAQFFLGTADASPLVTLAALGSSANDGLVCSSTPGVTIPSGLADRGKYLRRISPRGPPLLG